MEPDLFKYLPLEIIISILSRLPVRSIAISKCVCKSWLDLLSTDDFVKTHFAKSVPSLAVLMPEKRSHWCKVFEFEDDDIESSHDRRYNPLTKFDFRHSEVIVGAANGLLLLQSHYYPRSLYICNPITRQFIELHYPQGSVSHRDQGYDSFLVEITYGFGGSKMTGEHKVIRIFRETKIIRILDIHDSLIVVKLECRVYTLGTGSWRSVEAGAELDYSHCSFGAFVNGNLHWILSDSDGTPLVSCFDLEMECFTTFCVPPPLLERGRDIGDLSVLKDSLCLCDTKSCDDIVIWLMKECGVEKSWSKEYVIPPNPDFDRKSYDILVYPIKVFKDGDILVLWDELFLFYYSNKTKTTHRIDIFDARLGYINSVLLAPSFLSLKSFHMEDVISF